MLDMGSYFSASENQETKFFTRLFKTNFEAFLNNLPLLKGLFQLPNMNNFNKRIVLTEILMDFII